MYTATFHTSFMCVAGYYRFNNIYQASVKSYHNVMNRHFFILAKNNSPVYCIGNLKDGM